jgi:trans-aconitate 2-methyltransferase
MAWDAVQYLKFAGERGRPFADLIAQVRSERPARVADLGCGAGNLTHTLAERWPDAQVVGVDSSPEMLAKAHPLAIPGRLGFVESDLASWSPDGPLDLIVSNAALHWVPDHDGLLSRLAGMLAPGGTLAVQMPDRFRTASQAAIDETTADPRWAASLAGVGLSRDSVKLVEWYVRRLRQLGFAVDAWQTTYVHVLTGQDPVLEWLKGTGLRPLLDRLGPLADEYLQQLGGRLRAAYPAEDGVTLFPFPRLFFVATR